LVTFYINVIGLPAHPISACVIPIRWIFANDYNAVELKNAVTLAVCDITQNIIGGCTEFCMLSSGDCTEGGTYIEKMVI
jgi:hypothetical protein